MLWTDIAIMEDLGAVVSNLTDPVKIGGLQPSSTILLEVTEETDPEAGTTLHVSLNINDEPAPMK